MRGMDAAQRDPFYGCLSTTGASRRGLRRGYRRSDICGPQQAALVMDGVSFEPHPVSVAQANDLKARKISLLDKPLDNRRERAIAIRYGTRLQAAYAPERVFCLSTMYVSRTNAQNTAPLTAVAPLKSRRPQALCASQSPAAVPAERMRTTVNQ